MSNNVHEFLPDKKLPKGTQCMICKDKVSGFMKSSGFKCRNCLKILCKKCKTQPENVTGCGPPDMGGAGAAAPAMPAMNDPVMDFYVKYVKRNAKGEMVVRGLPEELKNLFRDAGVKPKELKDPKTASFLVGLMHEILGGGQGALDAGAAAPAAPAAPAEDEGEGRVEALYDYNPDQPGDLTMRKGDIVTVIRKYDNGWADGRDASGNVGQFPFNYVKELPPEPKATPPPPPAPRADAPAFPEPVVDTPAAPVAAPPAPAPPPMPVNAPAPPPPPPAGAKKPAAPAPPAAGTKPAPSGGAVRPTANDFASMAGKLRKVEDTPPPAGGKKELKDLTAAERTNMLDILSSAMNQRRRDINDDDDDDDDDGWSDDDDF